MKRRSRLSQAAGAYNWRRGQILCAISLCRNLSYEQGQDIKALLQEELNILALDYEAEMRRLRKLHA